MTVSDLVTVVAAAALLAPIDHVSAQHDVYARTEIGRIFGNSLDNTWPAGVRERLSANSGLLGTISMGYRWDRWRGEVELAGANQYISGPVARVEADDETIYVYNLATRSAFASVYRLFPRHGQLVPYAGLGVGAVRVSVDYDIGWQRPEDYDATGDALVCLLSFLLACGEGGTYSDEVAGYRLFAGADYEFGRLAVGLKLAWMGLIGLEGRDRSYLGRYGVATDHLSSVFLSIGFSYRLGRWGQPPPIGPSRPRGSSTETTSSRVRSSWSTWTGGSSG